MSLAEMAADEDLKRHQEYRHIVQAIQDKMAQDTIWRADPNAPPNRIYGFHVSTKKAPITDGPTDK